MKVDHLVLFTSNLKSFFLLLSVTGLLGTPSIFAQSTDSEAPVADAQSNSHESNRDQFSGKVLTNSEQITRMIRKRLFNAPRVGEKAPPFTLPTADGKQNISLSHLHKKKPVVLIFSSWGCDIFRESLGGLQLLYTTYSNKAEFVMIYIREAHPFNGYGGVLGRIKDLNTLQDRMAAALRCRQQTRLPFRVLCDTIDDPVTTRWAAWPVRLFVVDTDGVVAYAGAQGPWGYRPYDGYLHGDGEELQSDQYFSKEPLEDFLEKRFPSQSVEKELSKATQTKTGK